MNQDLTASKRLIFVLLAVVAIFSSSLWLSGCSLREKYDIHVANDEKTLNDFVNNEAVDYSVYKDELGQTGADAKIYFDEKTGLMVTKAQHTAYTVIDSIKQYGLWIALGSFSLGFLIRRFVKDSVAIRRFGLLLEIAIPLVYIILAYVGSYIADRI